MQPGAWSKAIDLGNLIMPNCLLKYDQHSRVHTGGDILWEFHSLSFIYLYNVLCPIKVNSKKRVKNHGEKLYLN